MKFKRELKYKVGDEVFYAGPVVEDFGVKLHVVRLSGNSTYPYIIFLPSKNGTRSTKESSLTTSKAKLLRLTLDKHLIRNSS